jgi:hypothetical protein
MTHVVYYKKYEILDSAQRFKDSSKQKLKYEVDLERWYATTYDENRKAFHIPVARGGRQGILCKTIIEHSSSSQTNIGVGMTNNWMKWMLQSLLQNQINIHQYLKDFNIVQHRKALPVSWEVDFEIKP